MAEAASAERDERSGTSRLPAAPVWDPRVRLSHWGIAAAVLLNGLLVEGGALIHVWLGYGAFTLLALRLVWGFIGMEEARFSSFPPSLTAAVGHLADLLAGKRQGHRSHNPLGALMAYALWGSLFVVSVTGIVLESAPFPETDGAVSNYERLEQRSGEDDDRHEHEEDEEREGFLEEAVEELHEATANLLLLFAALHVGGVVLESRLSGVNLIGAMTTGTKPKQGSG